MKRMKHLKLKIAILKDRKQYLLIKNNPLEI
jgi:hypothetical protein